MLFDINIYLKQTTGLSFIQETYPKPSRDCEVILVTPLENFLKIFFRNLLYSIVKNYLGWTTFIIEL